MATENGRHEKISADEVALYDRQIRLWGMAAQERMRNAHVLIISMKALSQEVVKNLVLAGIGAVTLLDDENVSEADLGAQFLVSDEDIGQNRAAAAAANARKLNPRVSVHIDQDKIASKTNEFFVNFDVVIACNQNSGQIVRLNEICRELNRPFYTAEIPGMTGYIFADIIEHDFVTEKEETNAKNERSKVSIPHKETFVSFGEVLKHTYGATLRPRHLKKVSPLLPLSLALIEYKHKYGRAPIEEDTDFRLIAHDMAKSQGLPESILSDIIISDYVQGCQSELSAVAAIVGGVLSQDVLNVLSGREAPIQNFLVFDGETTSGPIYKL